MKRIFTLLLAAVLPLAVFAQDGLPANPTPGKCYVKCVTPDVFENASVEVISKPAYTRLRVIPAVYKTVTETVITKEASFKYVFVPAVWKTETVTYVKKQAGSSLRVRPATFSNSSQSIETEAASSRWEYSNYAGCKSNVPGDCKTLCYKEYPARSTSVSIKKLATDATTSKVAIGSRNGTYTKSVLVSPASYRKVDIPQQTRTITKTVLVSDAKTTSESVPAVTKTVTIQKLKTKGTVGTWTAVDCGLLNPNLLGINFSTGSAALSSTAKRIIDTKVLSLMNSNAGYRVQISAHTDAQGSASSNQALSQRRADSVVAYLVSKGISRSRLVSRGYGESRLLSGASNYQNRRVAFKILK